VSVVCGCVGVWGVWVWWYISGVCVCVCVRVDRLIFHSVFRFLRCVFEIWAIVCDYWLTCVGFDECYCIWDDSRGCAPRSKSRFARLSLNWMLFE